LFAADIFDGSYRIMRW